MGIYDSYEDVQLKVGDVGLACYKRGDPVDIADGVYIAPNGLVVIDQGKLVRVYAEHEIWDKWGGRLDLKEIVGGNNPVNIGISV